jgi:hypothetical protein
MEPKEKEIPGGVETVKSVHPIDSKRTNSVIGRYEYGFEEDPVVSNGVKREYLKEHGITRVEFFYYQHGRFDRISKLKRKFIDSIMKLKVIPGNKFYPFSGEKNKAKFYLIFEGIE